LLSFFFEILGVGTLANPNSLSKFYPISLNYVTYPVMIGVNALVLGLDIS
jgi:hypothetical protein